MAFLSKTLESINWDSEIPDNLIYFADRSDSKPDLTLPPAPVLTPPTRIALSKPQPYNPLRFPGETMKLLYDQVDACFELMCENHDTHLILFQINSALRKCAESFSGARSKYIQALQQKFLHVVTTGRRWKKENVRLDKAVIDADAYRRRIEEIKTNREKVEYEVESTKRATAQMHLQLDEEREKIDALEQDKLAKLERIKIETKEIQTKHHEEVFRSEQLEKKARKFVCEFTLMCSFKRFRQRVKRQKQLKIFRVKSLRTRDFERIHFCFSKFRKFLQDRRKLIGLVASVEKSRKRRLMLRWKTSFVLERKSGRHYRSFLLRKGEQTKKKFPLFFSLD